MALEGVRDHLRALYRPVMGCQEWPSNICQPKVNTKLRLKTWTSQKVEGQENRRIVEFHGGQWSVVTCLPLEGWPIEPKYFLSGGSYPPITKHHCLTAQHFGVAAQNATCSFGHHCSHQQKYQLAEWWLEYCINLLANTLWYRWCIVEQVSVVCGTGGGRCIVCSLGEGSGGGVEGRKADHWMEHDWMPEAG